MATDQLSIPSRWHRTSFGRRLMVSEPPYFEIAHGSDTEDRDASRRQAVIDLVS